MEGFYWSQSNGNLIEFFSHYKVVLIEISALLVIAILLYRFFSKTFYIKRTLLYIPLVIYVAFVFLSFAFSEYKVFAWGGWNDRFEGTATILCYVIMLFFIINSVDSDRDLKWVLYPVAIMTVILSLIGISQATGHDFFQSAFGQKLITPDIDIDPNGTKVDTLKAIDAAAAKGEPYLKFTFEKNEIYQTVYNINYVSFYLTLLLPLFGMVFIREKQIVKKSIWGVVFALLIFNLIGSASSGGLLGSFVLVALAIVIMNKRLKDWWKPLSILVAIVAVVSLSSLLIVEEFGGVKWTNELQAAVKSVLNIHEEKSAVSDDVDSDKEDADTPPDNGDHRLDYLITKGKTLTFSVEGNKAFVNFNAANGSFKIKDAKQKDVSTEAQDKGAVLITDKRFKGVLLTPTKTENEDLIIILTIDGEDQIWPFVILGDNSEIIKFYDAATHKPVDLTDIPHWGFTNNSGFGSGRGYIWSRSFPLLTKTLFVGHGADTYGIYFPHNDFVGRYQEDWNIYTIVDKPHNMYIGIALGTGLISLIAFLVFIGIYLVQSFRIYRILKYDGLASYMGFGIFLGVVGFMVSGIVNDSTVSVMPLFYGLLGTGIACNMINKRVLPASVKKVKAEPAVNVAE
jgi:O-antigen ligase